MSTLTARPPALSTPALLAVFALIGINLRATFGAVPPLLEDIQADLGLSGPALGLLTAIPVLCLGVLAPGSARLAARVGHERLTTFALALLTAAEVLRLAGQTVVLLYLSILLAGAAMAAMSTVMPGLIGHHLHRGPGLASGIYATAMATGSTCAAYVAVPLAASLGGWTRSLAAWALPTTLTLVCWLLVLPRLLRGAPAEVAPEVGSEGQRLPWRSRTAWVITGYFGLQTFVGFAMLTWLAPAYREMGWTPAAASRLLSVFFAVQILAMLVLPALTDRTRDRRPLLAASLTSTAIGVLGFAAVPELAWVAVTLFGLGLGGGFALGLVLLVDATTGRGEAARLSAMVFLLSYSFAATGPLVLGALRDLTGGYTTGFWLLVVVGVVHLAVVPFLRPGRS